MNFRVKKFLFLLVFLGLTLTASSQTSGSFTVNGDIDKFYPVVFQDAGWSYSTASELEIGRSNIHKDSVWRGSLIAKFRYHSSNWGHGSEFIDADIRQYNYLVQSSRDKFIAGWREGSALNSSKTIIIWLRGSTSYDFVSKYPVTPQIYDGVINALPYAELNGPQHSFKTTIDSYVNEQGKTYGSAYFTGVKRWTSNNWGQAIKLGSGHALELDAGATKFGMGATSNSFFYLFTTGVEDQSQPATYRMIMNANGEIGIGTAPATGFKLAVDGTVGARKVKVTQGAWADFVFHDDYKLPSLQEVEKFIKLNKHLPEIPSEKEVAENGIDLGEMNKKLLQKIEEMTLHMIEMEKRIQELENKQQKQD
ncbi:hypothetical protein SAMN05660909_03936 [Chitinophaga terrae (ex Kim and Jung 2007)]|uniref:Uncharacterized protein n=1 Tax=Chitinophaga terrae (ex Kim and Jung 2007) TaxID=408074 RepID=A0A1H4ET10_9BACT|nr:hypothetical protein [Chitinophaga terrae (ex Kim and Jung 2007)]MDQ0109006.1 hypothetical protein [Chitinophaga terrae (ex Kim and Jung 2007)]SEA88195.1 hypothetical protein SAMN05660909_03936 [Chitinophaga terrae (ex Kim and Jung 2007)]